MKKIVSMILAMMMVFSMSIAFAAEENYFYDISKSKNEEAIEYLHKLGIIEGYGDHQFGPKDTLTRAQACALIVRAMLPEEKIFRDYNDTFNDVAWDAWYREYVDTAYRHGYMHGCGDNKFAPTEKVTYAEFATILTNVLGYDATKLPGNWPTNTLAIADKLNLFENTTKNIVTNDKISREDAAQMIYNTFDCNLVEFVNGKIVKTTAKFVDIINSDYNYKINGTIAHIEQAPTRANRFIADFWMLTEENEMIRVYAVSDKNIEIGDKVVVKFDHAKNAEIVKVTHVESEKVVYVTKEGNHYHYSNDCSYLIDNRDNMIEIPESVAIQFGYADACGICAK